jgi:CBS domain-containing protein
MRTVQDVMTRSVITVDPGTPIREVARLLVDHGVSGLPVVDASGAVIGVVSEGDLLIKEQGHEGVRHRPLARLFGESRETRSAVAKVEARTAGDAMSRPAVTIDAWRPLQAAADIMVQKKVNRLPVIDQGKLVGIVTRADLVRAFVRSDEELAETIRSEVLLRALWLNPVSFDIVVRDGEVHIRGKVERRSTSEMLPRFVEMVPGVVTVEADVEWSVDDREIQAPAPDLVGPYGP